MEHERNHNKNNELHMVMVSNGIEHDVKARNMPWRKIETHMSQREHMLSTHGSIQNV